MSNWQCNATSDAHVRSDMLVKGMTYVFDVQWVASDPLHRFQQEAGQRHAFTPVVCGNFLMEIKVNINNATGNPQHSQNYKWKENPKKLKSSHLKV